MMSSTFAFANPNKQPSSSATGAAGFTIIELMAVMAVIAIVITLALPKIARRPGCGKVLADSSRIRGVHQSWITFSREFDGVLPAPGLIRRQPVDAHGVPGLGKEDRLLNTTANLHSVCIMNNYYTPELCVGATEPSGKVFVKDDYNYETYNAAINVFWDSSLKADVQAESHVSYASMPIAGERQRVHWREQCDPGRAMLGNRGVRNGSLKPAIYDRSITLLIHGDRSVWQGHICFADNHVEFLNTFTPESMHYLDCAGHWQPDNFFRNDNFGEPTAIDVAGTDNWLAITLSFMGASDEVTGLRTSWD
jgi:prepilin-type N-terminal cleavage/methylation domain-containing protein